MSNSNSDYFSKIAADYDAVFNLIDVVFSLESCLRHQVLPLELFDNHLVLGMIDPKDKEAIKFVLPIIQSLGYTFHTQAIDTQTHQLVLAAYLKSSPKDSLRNSSSSSTEKPTSSTLVEQASSKLDSEQAVYNSQTIVDLPTENNPVQPVNNSPTIVEIPESEKEAQKNYDSATLVDLPQGFHEEKIPFNSPTIVEIPESEKEAQKNYDSATLVDLPQDFHEEKIPFNSPTIVEISESEKEAQKSYDSATLVDLPQDFHEEKIPFNSPTIVEISESEEEIQNSDKFSREDNLNNQLVENLIDSATLVDLPREKPQEEDVTRTKNKNDYKQTVILDQSSQPEQLKILSSTPQINNLQANQEAFQENEIKIEKDDRFNPTIVEQEPDKERGTSQLSEYSPKILWQELLTKIVSGEVDKLYFQQHQNYGSISCSQDGAVEPLLEQVTSSIFKDIIKEIKLMAKLPLTTLDKHRKIAIPRLYNQERVLLRAEFFPSKFGEEITMQVFQGEALKFYEQRQADRTIEQAINLGQKLEKALNRMMTYQSSIEMGDLSTLSSLVRQIEQKLKSLESSK